MKTVVHERMARKSHSLSRDISGSESYVWPALLSISGLGFWFFLGFPFGNHNESFAWVGMIRHLSLGERLMPGLGLSRTYRPLGQLVVMVLYTLGGDRIFLVQLFNFAVAASSIGLLVCTSRNKGFAALLAAVVGGTCFPGFIYLFHLHGVFYSPVLLMIVIVLWLFADDTSARLRKDVTAWLIAILAFLFHPYALLIFCAIYAGVWLKRLQSGSVGKQRISLLVGFAIIAASGVMTLWAKESTPMKWSWQNIEAARACFRSMEVHWVLSAVAAALSFFTIWDLMGGRRKAAYTVAAVTSGAVLLCFWLDVPVLVLWILACLGKTIVARNWPLMGLVLVSVLLPAISPTGSPTYGIFAILACIAAMISESRLGWASYQDVAPRPIGALLFIAVLLVISLRAGVKVPLVSRFAQPLLAERDKTYQLEEIVNWWENSNYRSLRLTLYDQATNPVDSLEGIAARRFRPPTYQGYLDVYVGGTATPAAGNGELLLTFGDDLLSGLLNVHTVAGRFARPARVYLAKPSQKTVTAAPSQVSSIP